MKKIISVVFLAFFFISCDPSEAEEEISEGGLLDKMTVGGNGDSTVSQFSYDAQGKLTGYVTTEYPGNVPGYIYVFTRDNNGKIIKTSVTEHTAPPLETYITYQPGTTMFKSAVSYSNQAVVDSSAFVYTNGNVTEHLYYFSASSGQYNYSGRFEYTLQAGNVVKLSQYNVASGSQTPHMEIVYTYDSNLAPILQTFEEAYLADTEEFFVTNNVTKAVTSFPSFPGFTETVNLAYTYVKSGQPATAQMTSPGVTGALNFKFIYK